MRGLGGVTALTLEASDAADAARQATAHGYSVVSVQSSRPALHLPSLRRIKFPLVQFSQELQALLQAGLTLVDAMETLAGREMRTESRAILTRVVNCLHQGRPFSFALRQEPDTFPALYVASIQASEKTGAVAEALARYVEYQLQIERVRRQVISASIYPALLAGVGTLVAVFMLGFVVPRFSHIYADIGRDLPTMSRWLMNWGNLVARYPLPTAGIALGTIMGIWAAMGHQVLREGILQAFSRLPGIGRRMREYQLARFYRSLGMLLRGGIPVTAAMTMSMDLLGGELRAQVELASIAIQEGQPLSRAMEGNQLTTTVAERLLIVGEHTGRMGEMMERIATFHEEETARWVEHFTRLFEPLLMVLVGGVIGLIVLLMYFPIFDLAGSIQ